jgi:hypothetical protein
VAQVQPAAIENEVPLFLQDLRIREHTTRNLEKPLLALLTNPRSAFAWNRCGYTIHSHTRSWFGVKSMRRAALLCQQELKRMF